MALNKTLIPSFEDFGESLPDAILVIDRYRDILWGNRAARLLLATDALVGKNLLAFCREPDLLRALEETDDTKVVPCAINQRGYSAHVIPLYEKHVLSFHDTGAEKRIDQLRRDFVANVSHELRTPLTAIASSLDTLSGAAKNDPEAQDRFINAITRQVLRMKALVNDLLALSRIEEREHEIPQGHANIRMTFHDAIETVGITGVEISISREFPDWIPGDQTEITQVIENLLGNAKKYGAPPYNLSAAIVDDPVLIATYCTKPAKEMAHLTMTDHGPGIADKHLLRLTERFYRAHHASAGAVDGTGLGLAIVKHILLRHRGSMTIQSQIDKGSVFSCFFPL